MRRQSLPDMPVENHKHWLRKGISWAVPKRRYGEALMNQTNLIRMRAAAVALALFLIPSCCICPTPGFAGVPELVDRSPDFALPLSSVDRERLLGFLFLDGHPPSDDWMSEDEDPAHIEPVEQEYGALLDELGKAAPTKEDLRRTTGRISKMFDNPESVLAVHDARIAEADLDRERVRGNVKGDFVFVFYWRRVIPIEDDKLPPTPDGSGRAAGWYLDRESKGTFTGLLVFSKTMAIPTSAE